MGKLGKCCCVGDCLTPFDCDTWQVNWDGYTPTINNSWQIIENTTASGNTLTASKTGTCGGLNVGTWSGTARFTYDWQYRLRIRKGHFQNGLTCGTWPTGFTGPPGKSLIGGSNTGISTFRTGSQCYAVFHVGIEVFIQMNRTIPYSSTTSGFTGPLAFCNRSISFELGCFSIPPVLNLCVSSTGVLAFSSEPIPYTVLADLNGTHTLYRNPGSCSAVGPTYRAALRLPTQSEVDKLIAPMSCFAVCPVPFRFDLLANHWSPFTQDGTVLPSTMTVTLGGCKAAGVVPD